MTTEPRVNLVNVATGLCFVALGILLLLQRGGLIDMQELIRLWPVALIVLGGAMTWEASRGGQVKCGRSFGGLVWFAILGLLFSYAFDRRASANQNAGAGQVDLFAVLSGDRAPAVGGAFTGGRITTLMGGASLDLRNRTMAPGETATIDFFTVMGGSEIRVPAGWQVDIQTITVMGGVKDQRSRKAEEATEATTGAQPPPRLVLRGTVIMGGVNVKS